MADIFISYASEDRACAEAVARALRAQGWTVWWDDHIAPGKRFDKVIEAELNQARCVVVLWSQVSVNKEWVLEEASAGKEREVLLPALIAQVALPLGFKRVQAANLVDWAPGAPHREFDALVASIEQLAPRPKAAPPPSPVTLPSRPVQTLRERDWRRLLDRMREGTVVPVVGPRLLLGADGRSSLMADVAARLLAEHEIDGPAGGLTPFRELDEAVSLLQRHKGVDELHDLHRDVHHALVDLGMQREFVLPRALGQLARIGDFRLMVTLTPDGLLAQALRVGGRAVNEVVHSPRLPTSELGDLPHDRAEPGGAVQLLYALGKSRAAPLFAISEHEVEHYLDNLQSRDAWVPRNFLDALRDRNLLFIGTGFAGWLTRRVVRTLGAPRDGGRSLPDEAGAEQLGVLLLDPEFGVLMQWDGPPAEFVAELHRRWLAEQAAAGSPAPPPGVVARPMFFISCSRRTDLDAAVCLHDALTALGVAEGEIWFDRSTTGANDDRQHVLAGIRNCHYFVAIVSRDAVAREEDPVFAEWEEATRRAAGLNRSYLLPVSVDPDFRPDACAQASVSDWRERGIAFGHAPGGQPDEPLMLSLRRLVREARVRGDEP